jgi:hypothetical protein
MKPIHAINRDLKLLDDKSWAMILCGGQFSGDDRATVGHLIYSA